MKKTSITDIVNVWSKLILGPFAMCSVPGGKNDNQNNPTYSKWTDFFIQSFSRN